MSKIFKFCSKIAFIVLKASEFNFNKITEKKYLAIKNKTAK